MAIVGNMLDKAKGLESWKWRKIIRWLLLFLFLDLIWEAYKGGTPLIAMVFDSISNWAVGRAYVGPALRGIIALIFGYVMWKMWKFFFRHSQRASWLPWWTGLGLIGKASKKWYEWFKPKPRRSKIWGMLKERGWAPFLLRLKKSRLTVIKQMLERFDIYMPLLKNRMPYTFTQLRAELMVFMNWQTRLHTYFGKFGGVLDWSAKAKGIEALFRGSVKDFDLMSDAVDRHRFGETPQAGTGWNNNREMIQRFFNALKQRLESPTLRSEVFHGKTEQIANNINNQFDAIIGTEAFGMGKSFKQWIEDTQKIGLLHVLRSIKIHLLDLVAMYGVYKHYYRFANENAIFELWKIAPKSVAKPKYVHGKLENNPVTWDIDFEKLEHDKSYAGYREYVKAVKGKRSELIKIKSREFMNNLQEKIKASRGNELIQRFKQEAMDELRRRYPRTTGVLGPAVKRWIEEQVAKELKRLAKEEFKKLYLQKDKEGEIFRRRYNRDVIQATEIELKKLSVRNAINREVATVDPNFRLGFAAINPDLRHEVDIKGFVLEDVHAIEVDHKNPKYPRYIRRVRIEDIEDFPSRELMTWTKVYEYNSKEWYDFILDLRWGHHHPLSRSDVDYIPIISRKTLYLKSRMINRVEYPKRTTPDAANKRAAFDLEALKYSGKYVYWGRKNYWDPEPVRDRNHGNPYPTLSSIGLSRILSEIIKKSEGESETINQFLSYWVWDNAAEENVFSSILGTEGESK